MLPFLFRSQIKDAFEDGVKNGVLPIRGGIVYCDLVGVAEHTGVYVGNNKIVHLNGDGDIEAVSPKEFIGRNNGRNPARNIYVSCFCDAPTGSKITAKRAESMIGKSRNYHFIINNCHQFTSGCITGEFENPDNFFTFLKNTIDDRTAADNWRPWRREGKEFVKAK